MAGPQAQQPISQTEGASASRALRPLSLSAPSSSSSSHIPSNNVLEHIEIEVEDDHQRIGDGDGIESCSGSIKRYTASQRSANRSGGAETSSRKNNEDGNSTRGGGTNGGGDGGDSTNDDDDNDDEQSKKRVRHRHRRPLYRRFFSYIKTAWTGVNFSSPTDSELEELETPPRYRPDSIRALCRATRFTEAEIKRIYRGFKAECPTGVVKEETFKIIYAQFFPQGANTGLYAHYVFNTLDQDHSGIVSFEEFVQGLSILSRGSMEEKLRWTFSLYDINGDGFITRDEMTDIVTAIYELVGRHPDSVGPEISKINDKVDTIFQKMDRNCDGVVTLEEFLTCCRNDDAISRSMAVFDTSF